MDPERIPSSSIERYRKRWWSERHEAQYLNETTEWIRLGFLTPTPTPPSGCKFIPWSCTDTPEKTTPLRLALDFVPVNEFVLNRSEWSEREVCSEQLLRWRTSSGGELVDVKKAYLRIRVDPRLWRFQCVRVQGQPFSLTRLAFGLSSAPRILKKVLDEVLKGLPVATFRDDVFIPQEVLTDELRADVVRRLAENGFPTKPPAKVGGDEACKVLGLKVARGHWKRKVELQAETLELLQRARSLKELAGLVGQISPNSYPVQRWLRPLANAIRSEIGRQAAGDRWREPPSGDLLDLAGALADRLRTEGDPVGGVWQIPASDSWEVWTDASKDAVGYVLRVGASTIEDSSSRSSERERKLHINVRELDAVVMALTRVYQIAKVRRAPVRNVAVFCDNRSVTSWLRSLVSDEPIRLQTMSFALVDHRLELVRQVVSLLGASLSTTWVKSEMNIADELTRTSAPGKTSRVAVVQGNGPGLRERLTALHRELIHKGEEILVAAFLKECSGEFSEREVRSEAKRVVGDCRAGGPCLYKSPKRMWPSETGLPCHQATEVNAEVFIDFLKVDASEQARYIGAYNILDAYSRKLMTVLSSGPPNREGAITAVMQWTSQYGPVRVLRCDRGREFSNILGELSGSDWGPLVEEQRMGSVLHPQSQGTIERCHRELLSCVRVLGLSKERRSWHVRYLESVRVWNARPHQRLGWNSPLEVWNGAEVPQTAGEEAEEEFPEGEDAPQLVAGTRLSVGDRVLWQGHGRRKDMFHWEPGEVLEVLPRGAYRVKFKRGNQNSTTERIVNEDRLALASGPDPPAPAFGSPPDQLSPPGPPQLRRSARIANRNRVQE
jgi:hypothetical protein